ncbi:protocadherin-23 [Lissotriton helveticus]
MPGELSSMFTVDSSTGVVYLLSPLSHLAVTSVTLEVSARDGGGLVSHVNAAVTLNILQTALAPAIFEKSRYSFSVPEDILEGSTVGTVKATEPLNSLRPVFYKIVSGDPNGSFSIDQELGILRTKKQLDHELQPVVILTVQSQLGSSAIHSCTQVNITVMDVNDNTPFFPKECEMITVHQSTSPGTAVFIAHAEDVDSGLNGAITYSLIGEKQSIFFIDPHHGMVYLNGSLHSDSLVYEHMLQIIAEDNGTPRLSSHFNLTVIVEKQENSSTLAFDYLIHYIEIRENFPLDARILQVQAHMLGPQVSSNIAYSLEASEASAVLGIHPSTGWLFLRRPLDYESKQMYSIKVIAKSSGSDTEQNAITSVIITVQDENDNLPTFTHSAYYFNVEESSVPQGVIGTISAVDKDSGRNGQLSYFLLSEGSYFRMNSKTGEIINWVSLDREQTSYHELSVLVTDHGAPRHNSTATVHIAITDVNDNEPVFPQFQPGKELRFKVLEAQPEGTFVTNIYAKDRDAGNNGTIVYSISSGTLGHFKIDVNSGEIRTAAVLSYSGHREYRLVVTASDQGVPSLQAHAVLNIQVIPVLELKSLMQSVNHLFLLENVPPLQAICSLKSLENPVAVKENVHFKIAAEDEDGHFHIDHSSGELFLVQELDYELSSHFLLRIIIEDQTEEPPQNSTVFLNIEVGDVNDHSPSFPNSFIAIAINENVPVGTMVHTFNAKDGDGSMENSWLKYSVNATTLTENSFSIHPWHGTLTTTLQLDREVRSFFVVTVTATDQSAVIPDRRQSSVTAKIVILDINDNSPTFVSSPVAHILENAEVGAFVHRFIAKDPDEGRNGEVAYTITSGNEDRTFSLDTATGLLALSSRLDHEVEKYYSLTVVASDSGVPSLSSTQSFTVTVIDVNDVTPSFKQQQYETSVSENRDPGEFVIKVEAVDADSGVNSLLSFEILPGIGYNLFNINSETGEIKTSSTLDRETQGLFRIKVLVKDAGTPSLSSTTIIMCTVLDENDNAPKLLLPSAEIRIQENREPGVILTALAVDQDAGINGSVQYKIVGGNSGKYIAINSTSGELWATQAFDREEVSNFSLIIECHDLGRPKKSTEAKLNIIVLDTNDNTPAFTKNVYRTSLREDLAAGSVVLDLLATDKDEGSNGEVTYSLTDSTMGVFAINKTTGAIVTTQSLDRETTHQYIFRAVACDCSVGGPKRCSTTQVVVYIEDINDNTPHFRENPVNAHIYMKTTLNKTITTVRAIDPDQGTNGTVEFHFADDEPLFHINRHTGEVQILRIMTYETLSPKVLKVLAVDQGQPPRTATGLLVIYVLGQAHSIEFVHNVYEAVLPENSSAGASVTTVEARDHSLTRERVRYSIFNGDEDAVFSINSETGEVTVKEPSFLDFEATKKFNLVILAENLWQTAYCTVIVFIQDVNDNLPRFEQQHQNTSVSEGQTYNTYVLQVFAIDEDSGRNGEIEYSIISGNENKEFIINSSTGILETNAILDREIVSVYRLMLQAMDKGNPNLSTTSEVTIEVMDINDNAPTIPPLETVIVPEDAPLGYTLTQLSANDVDLNPTISYSLTDNGNPGFKFALDRYTGVLTLAKPLDYEEAAEYRLRVQASDSLHHTETEVTIRVSDVNDNAPMFTQDSYQVVLPELAPVHTSVLTVSATDRDSGENGMISYQILPPLHDCSINPIDGSVFIGKQVSSERNSKVIHLLIEAKDHGSPALSAVASVEIQIQDINNCAPQFTDEHYSISVSEDVPVGTSVLTFSAIDHDWSPDNTFIDYFIISGNTQNTFVVETTIVQIDFPQKTIGYLVVESALDRETTSTFKLTIIATDRGTPTLNSTATVLINVLDANDNPPVFTSLEYHAEVRESTSVNRLISVVSANDNDIGANADITYSIVSGNELGHFRLDRKNGSIEVAKALDYETILKYTLTIQATDGDEDGGNVAFVILSISVLDDNDFVPVFLFPSLNCVIRENLPALTHVCAAKAQDFDSGLYGLLTYSFQSPCLPDDRTSKDMDLFSIDPLTGDIYTRQTLDYERQIKYCFIGQAHDQSGSTATVTIHVHVEGVDEYDPVFLKNHYLFDLPENIDIGQVIGKLAASDNDGGLDGVIEYSLEKPSQFFSLNKTSGDVSLKRHLSRKRSNSWKKESKVELRVKAHSPRIDSRSTSCMVIVNISTSLEMYPAVSVHILYISLITSLVIFLILSFSLAVLVLRYKRKYMQNKSGKKEMSMPKAGPNDRQLCHSDGKHPAPEASITEWLCLVDFREKKDAGKQSRHSDSSGHGSAEGETAEDEEIKRINEHPCRKGSSAALSECSSRVPDSGIPRESAQLSFQSVETDVTIATGSAESINNFKEDSGGEARDTHFPSEKGSGKIHNILAPKEEDLKSGITGSYIFVPHGQDSRFGSLVSLVASDEDVRGSYNWDYMLSWEPRFQSLSSVFQDIAKLNDDASQTQSLPFEKQAFIFPPPLITSVAQPGVRAVPPRMPTVNAGPAVFKYPCSPFIPNAGYNTTAMTPNFVPSLSLLTVQTPTASPVATDPGLMGTCLIKLSRDLTSEEEINV